MLKIDKDERRILDGIRDADVIVEDGDTIVMSESVAIGLARLLTLSREHDTDYRVQTDYNGSMGHVVGYLSRGYLR